MFYCKQLFIISIVCPFIMSFFCLLLRNTKLEMCRINKCYLLIKFSCFIPLSYRLQHVSSEHGTLRVLHVIQLCSVRSITWIVVGASCLVADVGERVNRITAAGLTSRCSVQVPVPVLTFVTKDTHHSRPAGTLSRPPITETGTLQRTLSHLCPPPVTRAFWEIHNKYIKYMK